MAPLAALISVGFLFISCLTLFIWFRFVSHREVEIINKIPGPTSFLRPLIGNIHQFYTSPDKLWAIVRQTANDYYPIFRLWRFGMPMVMIRHPDDVEILLTSTKHITKGSIYEHLHPWLGTGLLTSTGLKWKNRRKILTPAFHFNVLHQFVDVFEVQSKLLVNLITTKGCGMLDLVPLYTKYTLNTICETAMGTKLDDEDERQEEFRKAVDDMGNLAFHLTLNPWVNIKWLFNLLPIGRFQTRVVKILHNFSNGIIRERKQYHAENDVKDVAEMAAAEEETTNRYEVEPKKRVALLDLLIQVWKKGGIDNIGIREEVDTFVFEGHDTTAAALIFTTLLLAENKKCQDEARKEVDEVFEKSKGNLKMAELQSLNYLEKCIKEALRLYPSVPGFARTIQEDLQLTNFLVPKGSDLSLLIYDLHRDPNFWPNPEEFKPERFDPEAVRNRHRYCYVPFSAGPRNCIGQKFAMLELKSSVAHILRHFHLEPVINTKNINMQIHLILRSVNKLCVKFIPRNNNEITT